MRADRLKTVKYSESEAEVSALFNNKLFSKFTAIDEQLYEIKMRKSKIKFGLSIQVGFMVLQYAKISTIIFYVHICFVKTLNYVKWIQTPAILLIQNLPLSTVSNRQ